MKLFARLSYALPLLTVACGQIPQGNARLSDANSDTDAFLARFQSNPKSAMNELPVKRDGTGAVIDDSESLFSQTAIKSKDFVTQKDNARKKFCKVQNGVKVCLGEREPGRAGIEANDRAEDLVDNGKDLVDTLEAMESKGLTSAKLTESPWSDDYWGLYRGVLGARYNDSKFDFGEDYQKYRTYALETRRAADVIKGGDASEIDNLSPSEKYDLLVGDSSFSLTASMWDQGMEYWKDSKKVETWMGICHGWAPAAFMLPRPKSAVTLASPTGQQISFYPSDIKALGSLLFAQTNVDTKFIGDRCNSKDPKADSNGRILDPGCFDNNPGAWHLAAVNQLGVSKRGFVIDATYDYEVWNQPVYSYTYGYFNPQDGKSVKTVAEAKIPLASYTNDKFKKYRSSKAVAVVGITMNLKYTVETYPTHDKTNSSERDALRSAAYYYDLELDKDGKIIGGEWYQKAHPDFVWTPAKDAKALTAVDARISESWKPGQPLPASFVKGAVAASRNGQPLAKIVYPLVETANGGAAPQPVTPEPQPNPGTVSCTSCTIVMSADGMPTDAPSVKAKVKAAFTAAGYATYIQTASVVIGTDGTLRINVRFRDGAHLTKAKAEKALAAAGIKFVGLSAQ